MRVFHRNNCIKVIHEGKGDGAAAKTVTAQVRALLKIILAHHRSAVVYHEAERLEAPDSDFVKEWVAVGKEFQDRCLYTVCVEKAWLRVIAKTVSFMGGFDVHIFKNEEEAGKFLRSKGENEAALALPAFEK